MHFVVSILSIFNIYRKKCVYNKKVITAYQNSTVLAEIRHNCTVQFYIAFYDDKQIISLDHDDEVLVIKCPWQ